MWTSFAKAALALPLNDESQLWKDAVPHLIELLAITKSLEELSLLPWADHAFAVDRARVGIQNAAHGLRHIWGSTPMPLSMLDIVSDANAGLRATDLIAAVVILERASGPRVESPQATRLLDGLNSMQTQCPVDGDLGVGVVVRPGTLLAPGSPVACVRGITPDDLREAIDQWWRKTDGTLSVIGIGPAVQIYRTLDETSSGCACCIDLVVPFDAELPPGTPLLAPLTPARLRSLDTARWVETQQDAFTGVDHAVVWSDSIAAESEVDAVDSDETSSNGPHTRS